MSDVEDFLAHHGILGMHWGVRKDEGGVRAQKKAANSAARKPQTVLTTKLKNGGSLVVVKDGQTKLGQMIGALHPSIKAGQDKVHTFTLRNATNKQVGTATFYQDSKESLYLDWIGINPSSRGHGYATATMKGVIKYAQDNGIKQLKLEVPGNAPDAKHIYGKLGFSDTGKQVSGSSWDGLSEMSLEVPQTQLAHDDSKVHSLFKYLVDSINDSNLDSEGNAIVKHFDNDDLTTVEDLLAHHGILGMHWGKHLPGKTEASHNPAPAAHPQHTEVRELKKNPTKALSNDDLQTINTRLQLEQTYSSLTEKKSSLARVKKGHDTVKTVLGIVGTASTVAALVGSPNGRKAIASGAKVVGKVLGKW